MTGTFDRGVVRELRDSLQNTLTEFEQKHGVNVHVGNASYSENNVTFKVEVANIVEGEVKSKDVINFEKYCSSYGLEIDDLGKTFRSNRRVFKITGLRPTAHKYPVLADDVISGKSFKFRSSIVCAALEKPMGINVRG